MVEPVTAWRNRTQPPRETARGRRRCDRRGRRFRFVVDDEPSIRHFLSLILHGAGIDTEEFADGACVPPGDGDRPHPNSSSSTSGSNPSTRSNRSIALGKLGYFGFVQLMSSRGSAVLEHVKSVGEQHGLQMLPVLKKPFETSAILAIMQELKLGHPAPTAARIELEEALKSGWIEFWYQPKIDLRKKQLAGVEAFARCRHPQFGILPPGAFMPGATEAELLALSEQALTSALQTGLNFSKLGINLRFAVNIPVSCAGEAADHGDRAGTPRAGRPLARADHRRHRRADRHRPRARDRDDQEARARST